MRVEIEFWSVNESIDASFCVAVHGEEICIFFTAVIVVTFDLFFNFLIFKILGLDARLKHEVCLGRMIGGMENWEENFVERTSFGLVKLAEVAIAVPVWEYVVLAFALTVVWLYRTLDFHFVEECLRGFRGEVPLLHFNPASKVAEHILPKCKNLKRR